MKRGVLLFAFNSPKFNYYEMAVATAKRVNHFLDLPVTIVTDKLSIPEAQAYEFDNVVITDPDRNNKRDWGLWFNKGRYRAYELSPYDDTLLLDADYMINSKALLQTFIMPTDICCHNKSSFLLYPKAPQEMLSVYSFNTLWATVVRFQKTIRSKLVFESLEMIQNNFDHYATIHGFVSSTFRNDYALTIAMRLVNGHFHPKETIIPWSLTHIGKTGKIYRDTDDEFNTKYTFIDSVWQKGRIKNEYIKIQDFDFHVMNKENFMELIT